MTPQLSELIQIPTAFARSVHIEHDLQSWVEDKVSYLLTPLFCQMAQRVIDGLLSPNGNRAWTIIGPYGTGKSAAILALVNLLVGGRSVQLRSQIEAQDPSLATSLRHIDSKVARYIPVLLSGYRGRLTPAIYGAILRSAKASGVLDSEFSQAFEACDPNDANAVASLLLRLSEVRPCIVVIDELGKFLEHSAQHPEDGDVFVLQLLAEATARTRANPIALVTVLHQAADRYGSHLLQSQRQELAKVQGRFEEISFLQPIDQMLRLIGSAVRLSGPQEVVSKLHETAQDLAHRAWALGMAPPRMPEHKFVELMVACAPLHPVSALVLGPLFRRLAQSERSLFAFLSSHEPYGLRWFLEERQAGNGGVGDFYPPDRLFDYVSVACGTSLFSDHHGRRWAQVDAALDRLRDPSATEARVVKLVGLMDAVGETASVRASADLIRLALLTPEVEDALESLSRKSLLVYRRFMNAYRLWEGSDLDLDERVGEARQYIGDATPLDELLSDSFDPRPEVARRHSHLTGTLRFFSVVLTTDTNLHKDMLIEREEADGRLFYVLVEKTADLSHVWETARNLRPEDSKRVVVVALPIPHLVKAAALELRRLKWVQDNTPELATDEVARRELTARVFETRQMVQQELEAILHPTSGWLVVWNDGKINTVGGRRGLNQLLSTVCDDVYSQAPNIRNELINRRQPSSNAIAARRDLLERMIEAQRHEQLGIEGYPPHLNMYLSVLHSTGLHGRSEDGTWAFRRPEHDSPMTPVWNAWIRFLDTTKTGRRSLQTFWSRLQAPPFGVKAGVIPVLFCAMFLERELDVALYENGTFVPEIEISVMERISKNPERFEVRYCPLDGLRREVFDELRQAGLTRGAEQRLLSVVRPLVQFAGRLSSYSKSTKMISSAAQRVRFHLLTAREPEVLLFESLPEALGFPNLIATETPSVGVAQDYAHALQRVIQEIGRAYTDLLDVISLNISDALLVSGSPMEYRPLVEERVRLLPRNTSDLRLKGFVSRLSDKELDDRNWLESVGTFVVGKPPSSWNDDDRDRFGLELRHLARRFTAMESLALEVNKRGEGALTEVEAGRIGLTTTSGVGRECFFFVRPEMKARASEAARRILDVLRAEESSADGDAFRLAVIAEVINSLSPDDLAS